MKTPVIHAKDVTFRFFKDGKRNILNHADLDIINDGVTVLMGSSGCGKSTLAAVLAGLYPENGGYLDYEALELYGFRLADLDPSQRAGLLSMMFQNPDLQFCMDTLRNELVFCLENIKTSPSEMDGRIKESVKLFGLESLLDRQLSTLSGGEKQMVILCCLYAIDSKCILLDEPFANIDGRSSEKIVEILKTLKNSGKTIIAIDHRLDMWMELADEIILLDEGGKVYRRGFGPDDIEANIDAFKALGLFFPKQRKTRNLSDEHGSDILVLEDLTIKKTPDRKKFFKVVEEGEILIDKACAQFPKGAITAVLGRSGSGKTTTFLSILKQHEYEGTILVDGIDIRTIKPKDLYHKVGIVFQNPANQFITQNVEEEVCQSLRVWHKDCSESKLKEESRELLEKYGLYQYRRYSPYMLSQGQQRRLAVLSVLCGGQKILLLDEPTYGQDYRSAFSIMEMLKAGIERDGLTVIIITHDQQLASVWADKTYVLEDRHLKEVPGGDDEA